MPRTKIVLKCPNCFKIFRKREFYIHTGLNKRSKLPNCKILREKVLLQKELLDEKVREQLEEQFYLTRGTNEKKLEILTNKWLEYLFNKYGKTGKTMEKYEEIRNKIRAKILKEKGSDNYYRWFETKDHKKIDKLQPHYYNSKDWVWTKGLENPKYLGKGALNRRIYEKLFNKLFNGWDKKYKLASNELKRCKKILLRNLRGMKWAIATKEDRECVCCFDELDERDDWIIQFIFRHPKIYNELTEDEKFSLMTTCENCRKEEEQPSCSLFPKLKNSLWETEFGINNYSYLIDMKNKDKTKDMEDDDKTKTKLDIQL